MNDPEVPRLPDRRFSEEEFGLILRRAQELQDGRPETPRSARGTGMSLSEIRQIASEVGIDPKFVEQAAQSLPALPAKRHLVFGSPWEWEENRVVSGELPEDGKGRVLDAIRSVINRKGEIEIVYGRLEWTWNEDAMGPVQVRVVPDRDSTRVEVSARRASTMGMIFAFSIPLGAFLGGATLSELFGLRGPEVLVTVGSAAVGSWAIARSAWRVQSEKWRRKVDLLTERVTEAVKEGVKTRE